MAAVKAFKRQKLGEGIEWDSDKVVMREHVRINMGSEWPEDFGKHEVTPPDKPIADMSKEEYQAYAQIVKADKEVIRLGYRRIANKFKGLKQSYVKDCKDGLRSGAGQLTAKFWHDCHELWGGSAGTEPLDFGMETQTIDNYSHSNIEEDDTLCDGNPCDNTTEVVSPVSLENTSETRKRKHQSTKNFVDHKRDKLQKSLTQKARQDVFLQHSQKQVDIQQAMLETLNRKDEGLDTAIKSMAESTALLCNTLATTMQAIIGGMQPPVQHAPATQPQFHMNQYGYNYGLPQ